MPPRFFAPIRSAAGYTNTQKILRAPLEMIVGVHRAYRLSSRQLSPAFAHMLMPDEVTLDLADQ
jgi:hypothetical protein